MSILGQISLQTKTKIDRMIGKRLELTAFSPVHVSIIDMEGIVGSVLF